jgi:hypothetical protein
VSLSAEHSALLGCWHFIAVDRVTIDLSKPKAQQTRETEIAYCASSRIREDCADPQLLAHILSHWDAIENGVHRVRVVTFGEDAGRVVRKRRATASSSAT